MCHVFGRIYHSSISDVCIFFFGSAMYEIFSKKKLPRNDDKIAQAGRPHRTVASQIRMQPL